MKKVILLALFVPFMVQSKNVYHSESALDHIQSVTRPGDVVITEIMADPVPAVGLPSEEYLEILNRSENTIDLDGWRLISGNQNSIFPGIKIVPGEYLIVCAVSDTTLFKGFGRVAGLHPFPALTDKGKLIILCDDRGSLINGVEYSSSWYGTALKSNGGWSLEIIDINFPFSGEGNWEASSAKDGGTPGYMNSVSRSNPDKEFTGITNIFPEDSTRIIIEFREPVPCMESQINEIVLEEYGITALEIKDPLYRRFTLIPGKPLENDRIYTLYLPQSITDFAGNDPAIYKFSFGLPHSSVAKDLVFNELLFNPLPDNSDFIELVNISDKVLDASEFLIASVNTGNGKISEPHKLSSIRRCIIPGAYYVVTINRMNVISAFPLAFPENIFEVPSLPSMPDDKGHLLLFNKYLNKIDEVLYNEKMHYSLFSGREGISLEKIRPDLPSDESINWHSSSESSGWGTPGSRNSVFINTGGENEDVVLSSKKISPDNDGYEDVLVIGINSDDPGSIITVTLFNETGGFVKRLVENYLAGTSSSIVWDGTADDGTLVHPGIYILLIEKYNAYGRVVRWKKVCAVI